MKKFLFLLALLLCCAEARAQQIPSPSTAISTQQLTLLPQAPLATVTTVQESPSIQGSASYYYWFVSNGGGVVSPPAGPFPVNNAPSTLGGINTITVTWTPVSGVATYDVLRTTSTAPPTGACACAVVTGTASATLIDNTPTASLGAYTVNTTASKIPCTITNTGGCAAISGGSQVAPNQNTVYASPNCGTQPNCFTVKDNTQQITDATFSTSATTCSGNTVPAGTCVTTTGSDPPFSSADIGKVEYGESSCTGSLVIVCLINAVPTGTVVAVFDATHLQISSAATASAAGTGEFVWGSDDTSALKTAWAATLSTGIDALELPCGNMLAQSALFITAVTHPHGLSLKGCNGLGTRIVLTPAFDFTSCPPTGGLPMSGCVWMDTKAGYNGVQDNTETDTIKDLVVTGFG